MGMLDRIKKRQMEGFKEFVLNMEITGSASRQQIFTAGVLEDPIYMSWVMKNLRTFDDFLEISGGDIELVLNSHEQTMSMFAKSMFGEPVEKIAMVEGLIPKLVSKFRDELGYLLTVTPMEKDSARFYILKTARKFQTDEKIQGFPWKLPGQDVFYGKIPKEGQHKIVFENGTLAAQGEIQKGRRIGYWRHNYDSGKILAEGDYSEGLKTGVWVFYYGSGALKAQGKYKSDLKHGLWKEWDRNELLVEIEYNDGVKISR